MLEKTIPNVNGHPFNRLLMILVLICGSFCTVLNQTILATAYPTLMHYFDVNTSTVQWLTTSHHSCHLNRLSFSLLSSPPVLPSRHRYSCLF